MDEISSSPLMITISGVGALPDIAIRAEGITVLCGLNDTGKSTILKAIYSVIVPADSADAYIELIGRRIESIFGDIGQFRNIRSEAPAVIALDDILKCTIDDTVHVEGRPGSLPRSVFLPLGPAVEPDPHGISSEGLETLDGILGSISPGSFIATEAGIRYVSEDGSELSLKNAPAGARILGMLRILIANGCIRKGSILLLDDPEAHLHPAWINVLADALMAIERKMGVAIILTTHSPQLMMALEAGTTETETTMSVYHLYRTEERNIGFSDVTDNLETAYKEMATPIQDIASYFWE